MMRLILKQALSRADPWQASMISWTGCAGSKQDVQRTGRELASQIRGNYA